MMAMRILTLVFVLLFALPASGEPMLYRTIGHATELESGRLVYTEHHRIVADGGRYLSHEVTYKNPQGLVIATKTLDYSRSAYAPAFRLDDLRDGYIEGAEYTGQGYRLFYRKSHKDDMKADIVEQGDLPLVTDAGFNQFMVANMDRLEGGETLTIDLCVAERQTAYKFRGYKSGEAVIDGHQGVEITTEPNSRLIRLLVDPLKITFDAETRRLLAYEGATNIRRPDGKRYVARILFPKADFSVEPADQPAPVLTR